MKTALRIRLMGNIWKDAANDPPEGFYREFENIAYLIEVCQDYDTLRAAFDGMTEYRYFTVNFYTSFRTMEVITNLDTVGYYAVILKVEE